jgi:hypothetical protein
MERYQMKVALSACFLFALIPAQALDALTKLKHEA